MSSPETTDNDSVTCNIPEVAIALGIGETLAYQMAHEGVITDEFSGRELPVLKLRGRYVVSRRALHNFISGTQGASA